MVAAPRAVLRRPLVLIGMMGSGKSTVGRRLASVLGVPFADTDAEVERRRGTTVADIFATDGEASFRADEASAVADLVVADTPSVVATGGGAVIAPQTRALLRERATVVWLRASPGMLASRIADDGTRPLLADDPRAELRRLADERAPLYRDAADHVVDVDHVGRREVVDRVLDALHADEVPT